ncbi:MAG: DUF4476 domain-containing protein [Thermonemataceae bacterium]|nr:DUF4476 domain-containing protein [Thermonemataceae bacterium]
MKKILLSFVLLLVSFGIFAQRKCNNPLSVVEFNQKKREVMAINNEARKLQAAVRISKDNCLLASQVKDLAMLITDEYNRLEFTEKAYRTVFDPQNYYEVYDVFSKFSLAIRLYDFVNGKNTNIPDKPETPTEPDLPTHQYPNYSYPDYKNYTGKKLCNFPINENTFETAMERFRNMNDIGSRFTQLKQFVNTNCVATAQVMKATSLLSNDNQRLEVLKSANVYDIDNYQGAAEVLELQANKKMFGDFLDKLYNSGDNNKCSVSEGDFKNIIATIRKETGISTKISMTKTITKSYTCFSVGQARALVREFSSDTYRLDIAKYLYDYTAPEERKQYYLLTNELTFTTNRKSLMDYIEQKNK